MCFIITIFINCLAWLAGEMIEWLKILVILAEDQCSVPTTHNGSPQTSLTLVPEGFDIFSGLYLYFMHIGQRGTQAK